jgi:hypothetical protein
MNKKFPEDKNIEAGLIFKSEYIKAIIRAIDGEKDERINEKKLKTKIITIAIFVSITLNWLLRRGRKNIKCVELDYV